MAFQSMQGDYSAMGTIDGMLDAVNIHGPKNLLTLYPSIGTSEITCEFDDSYLDRIKQLIGCYVEISGEMKYHRRDKYPYAGVVSEIIPVSEDDLPCFADLYGMAPNATHGVPAEEFIAKVRSAWNDNS